MDPRFAITYLTQDILELAGQLVHDPDADNVLVGSDWGNLTSQIAMAMQPLLIFKKFVGIGPPPPIPAIGLILSDFDTQRGFFFNFVFQVTPEISANFNVDLAAASIAADPGYFEKVLDYLEPFGSDEQLLANFQSAWLTNVPYGLLNGLAYPRNLFQGPPLPPITFPQPALYIVGELDNALPWSKNPELSAQVVAVSKATKAGGPETIQFEFMQCSGHFPQYEDPDGLSRRVLRFLAE